MRHTRSRILAGVAVAAVAALAPGQIATAAPDRSGDAGAAQKIDDRADPENDARRAAMQEAVAQVVSGKATPQNKGGGKAVQISPGQWAQYGLQSTDSILTFLVDFGTQIDPRYPSETAGPVHNQIPEPDRSVDNSTYWVDNFDRDHFQDIFFGGGESMSNLYKEMSSGRYTVKGDTSDWSPCPTTRRATA